LGMLKAIEFYVPVEKGSFKTYASKFIRGRILQYLRDKTSLVKTPRISAENSNRVKTFLESNYNENMYLSPEYIAQKVNLPLHVVEDILNAEIIKNVVSLDQKVYSAEGVETLGDRIQSEYEAEYEESFENKKMLEYALNKLDKTERTVIYKYYIEGMTKKDIALNIGVSAMQVGRMIKRVLNKMYKILEKDFIDKEE